MARIRIVEAWLRCPMSTAIHRRAVMVVAEAWAEQRVLMRAYAASPDQTRPTIVLHGALLAIGPAGLDAHGPWGIHVEPPADGRAQALQAELEVAARRLFGSKGNPPRLTDEESSFDRGRTGYWAPGAPRTPPPRPGQGEPGYYEPNHASDQVSGHQVSGHVSGSMLAPTREGGQRARAGAMSGTVLGFAPGTGARVQDRRDSAVAESRPAVLGRTLPLGLRLTPAEHEVLHALGQTGTLTVTRVAELARTGDGATWMTALMAKLASCGLDLIATAEGAGGETVYVLRG